MTMTARDGGGTHHRGSDTDLPHQTIETNGAEETLLERSDTDPLLQTTETGEPGEIRLRESAIDRPLLLAEKGEIGMTLLTESGTSRNHQTTVTGKTSEVDEVSRETAGQSGVIATSRKRLAHRRLLATGEIARPTVTGRLADPTVLVTTAIAEAVAQAPTNPEAVTTEMTDHDKAAKRPTRSSATVNVPRSWLPCKKQQRISTKTASGA